MREHSRLPGAWKLLTSAPYPRGHEPVPPSSDAPLTAHLPQPLVSVCLPVFNGLDLVVEAVESALDQEYPNVEIVVVDDGSTDGTAGVLRRRYCNRIRLLVNPVRTGQSRATN